MKACSNCLFETLNGADRPCLECGDRSKWVAMPPLAEAATESDLIAEITRRALAGELSAAALDVLCALFSSGEDDDEAECEVEP